MYWQPEIEAARLFNRHSDLDPLRIWTLYIFAILEKERRMLFREWRHLRTVFGSFPRSTPEKTLTLSMHPISGYLPMWNVLNESPKVTTYWHKRGELRRGKLLIYDNAPVICPRFAVVFLVLPNTPFWTKIRVFFNQLWQTERQTTIKYTMPGQRLSNKQFPQT